MDVRLHPHASARLAERGTTEEEVVETVQSGERFPAKFGGTGFRRNFNEQLKTGDDGDLAVVNEALARRGTEGTLSQHQFWDRFVRYGKEFNDGSIYMHLNPVRRGLVANPESWRWSSYNNFALDKMAVSRCPIRIDYGPVALKLSGMTAGPCRHDQKPTVRKARCGGHDV